MSNRLLKMNEITDLFGVSRSTIYRWVDLENFPKAIKIASNTVRWRESDILKWQEGKH